VDSDWTFFTINYQLSTIHYPLFLYRTHKHFPVLQHPRPCTDQFGMNPAQTHPAVKPSRPLAQNRRQANRHQLHIPATLLGDGETAKPIDVVVTEISISGVGLRAKESLALDSVFQLTSFDTLVPPGMRVRIVSQQAGTNGEFKIGAKTV